MEINPDWRFDTIDVGAAYLGVRQRLTAMLEVLTPQQWEQTVPHCSAWTVRQTLSHLAGVVDDAINANLAGVGTDPWTAVQVAKRESLTGPEILEEWAKWAPFVEARFTQLGLAGAQGVFDAVTHEQDLRFGLNQPGGRDSEALRVGLYFIASRLATKVEAQLIVDGVPVFSNVAAPSFTLTASLFDTIRAASSRRSASEMACMALEGDRDAFMAIVPFALPGESLAE